MNVLHVSPTDLGAARFNGYSMMQRSTRSGFHIEMAVWQKESADPRVHQLKRGWLRLLNAGLARISAAIAGEAWLAPASYVLPAQACFRRADVVHLQVIQNGSIFSLAPLPHMSRLKPIVWTLHDAWPTTGMCIHSFDCERWLTGCKGWCPHPRGNSPLRHRTPALHWAAKRAVYARSALTLVVASGWMRDRVRRSPLLCQQSCHVIPFGIDLQAFSPGDKAASRQELGIPAGNKVIALRGNRVDTDRYKGLHWLREALTLYMPSTPTSLVILQDETDFKALEDKYHIVGLGWVRDEAKLAAALRAADVFVMPSIQESFGLMAVEAMACGTPVITFEGTAIPDVIDAPNGGMAVPSKDSVALAAALKRLLSDEGLRDCLGQQARRIAEERYAFNDYVDRHLQLYQDVAARHAAGQSARVTSS